MMMVMMLCHNLSENVNNERGERHQSTCNGNPDGGGLPDAGVLCLHLIGLHIDDIVLLEVIIG